MLLENVVEKVLVPLDQAVGVHLSVLHLLFPISLNTAQQGLHLVLLLVSESRFLLRDLDVELLLHVVDLLLLQRLTD